MMNREQYTAFIEKYKHEKDEYFTSREKILDFLKKEYHMSGKRFDKMQKMRVAYMMKYYGLTKEESLKACADKKYSKFKIRELAVLNYTFYNPIKLLRLGKEGRDFVLHSLHLSADVFNLLDDDYIRTTRDGMKKMKIAQDEFKDASLSLLSAIERAKKCCGGVEELPSIDEFMNEADDQ